jgi:hypothetical protein
MDPLVEELERAFKAWFELQERVNNVPEEHRLATAAVLATDLTIAEARYRMLHKAVFPEDWEEMKARYTDH